MAKRFKSLKIGTLLSIIIGIFFVLVAIIIVALVNYNMRQQALAEAEEKMLMILNRNLAVHSYYSQILKPNLFEFTEPIITDDYFDPSWMSSSYAVRKIGDYFRDLSSSGYYYKDAVINARNPDNEADADEAAFLIELKSNPSLQERSEIRNIDGEPYLVVMRPGEMLVEECLSCHGDPADAPGDLVKLYGSERAFNRQADLGTIISALSVRIPLAEAYSKVNRVSLQLSAVLLILLGILFAVQDWLPKYLVFAPLSIIRDKALLISSHEEHLGEQIAEPFGKELSVLTSAFNTMSVRLRKSIDTLEYRVQERTAELTKSEYELRESEEKFHALFEKSRVVMLLIDPSNTAILDANPAASAYYGWSLDELRQKSASDINIMDEDEIKADMEKAVAEKRNFFQFKHRLASGEVRDVEEFNSPIQNQDKTLLYSIVLDTTERKRFELALAHSEKNYRQLFEEMTSGFALHEIICDESGKPIDYRFLEINASFERLTGLVASNVIGKTAMEVLPMTEPYWIESYGRVALTGQPERFENYSKSLSKYFSVVAFSPENGKFAVLFDDITARKQAEQVIKDDLDLAERINKVMVDRELRMIELKKEINALLAEAGKEQKYNISDV